MAGVRTRDRPEGTGRSGLAEQFERERPHLRAVGYRLLGSLAEADDAVQESWLRLDRHPPDSTDELRPWLTTVVARISLDMLRRRRSRREEYAGSWLPEPLVEPIDEPSRTPEQEATLADSVGLALLVVLETLAPAERIAFVLHDVFGMPFEEIASVVDRSPVAARQLASRARRRVQATHAEPDADLAVERRVVDAFLAAARVGDLEALLRILDPSVVLRTDGGGHGPLARPPVAGGPAVADIVRRRAPMFARLCRIARVNGAAGVVVGDLGHVFAVVGLTIVGGRVREIDIIGDRSKLRRLEGRL